MVYEINNYSLFILKLITFKISQGYFLKTKMSFLPKHSCPLCVYY